MVSRLSVDCCVCQEHSPCADCVVVTVLRSTKRALHRLFLADDPTSRVSRPYNHSYITLTITNNTCSIIWVSSVNLWRRLNNYDAACHVCCESVHMVHAAVLCHCDWCIVL